MDPRGVSAPAIREQATGEPRFFTLEEANRTLPLVERIVRDIVEAYPRLQERLRSFQRLAAEPGPLDRQRLETLRESLDEQIEELNDFLAELRQIGCEFKGFEEGLVDFYSWRDGRPVFLCWKLGEDRIRYWHEVDAGYAGRQPIEPEVAAARG